MSMNHMIRMLMAVALTVAAAGLWAEDGMQERLSVERELRGVWVVQARIVGTAPSEVQELSEPMDLFLVTARHVQLAEGQITAVGGVTSQYQDGRLKATSMSIAEDQMILIVAPVPTTDRYVLSIQILQDGEYVEESRSLITVEQ